MARHHRTKHAAPRRRPSGELPEMTDDIAELLTASPSSLHALVQAKLTVGRVDDPAEVEADRAAAAFARWSAGGVAEQPAAEASAPAAARSAGGSGTMATGGFAVGGEVEAEIDRQRGGGQALPGALRGEFEGFFGADLGGVRVHADGNAAALSRSLGAEAFTVGNDVFFGAGRFAPDSAGGRDLLAHELTHVVQQGGAAGRRVDSNAVVASRSPLVVRRDVAEDLENELTEDGGNEIEGGDIGDLAGTTDDTTGAVSDFSEMTSESFTTGGESGGKVEASDKGVGHGEVIEVVNTTVGLVQSLKELYGAFDQPTTTKEKVWKILGALKAGADSSKSAINMAGAAAGGFTAAAAGAIPGLGLAVSVMSFVDSLLNKLYPLWSANRAESTLLEKVQAKLAGETDEKKKRELMEQVASLETLVSTTRRQIAFTLADMAGDIIQIVGQVATLAAGPFGLAVTALGGLTKLAAGVIGKIWDWVASHRAARAKEASDAATSEADTKQQEYEAAQAELLSKGSAATDDDKAKVANAKTAAEESAKARDTARMALYQSDANAAFKKVIDMAFAPLRENPKTGEVDAQVRQTLAEHGVSEQWINKTAEKLRANPKAPIDYNAAVEMAAAMVAVGPPMTIGDRIKSWGTSIANAFTSVWNWFKGLFTSAPPPMVDQGFVTDEAKALVGPIKAYANKKAEQGASGVKSDKVTSYLKSPYAALMKKVMTGAVDKDDRDRRMTYVRNAVPTIVEQALIGAKSGSKVIRKGDVKVDLNESEIKVTITASGDVDGKALPAPVVTATTAGGTAGGTQPTKSK